jgi:hypothetical protein
VNLINFRFPGVNAWARETGLLTFSIGGLKNFAPDS